MEQPPKISVITPFYEPAPAFLGEAIESILQQSFTAWELLLVDDGTRGESSVLAEAYAAKHGDRIRYLEHPGHVNCGMSASRNLGLRHARGQYIAFLDADDVWLPHTLGEQFTLLEAQPSAAMLYGNTEYWHSWTGRPEDALRDYSPALGVRPNTLFGPRALLPHFLEGRAAVPCTCGVLVRREAVEAVDGFEASFRNLYEDQVLFFKLGCMASIFVSDRSWGRYRQHQQASTQQLGWHGEAELARGAFLDWLGQYLCTQHTEDQMVWQALRRQEWLQGRSDLTRRAARRHRWIRWAKKWLLRFERHSLPPAARRWLWARNTGCG